LSRFAGRREPELSLCVSLIENDPYFVLNKVDLPSAEPDRIKKQIKALLASTQGAVLISAKTGLGIAEVLETIVARFLRQRATRSAR